MLAQFALPPQLKALAAVTQNQLQRVAQEAALSVQTLRFGPLEPVIQQY